MDIKTTEFAYKFNIYLLCNTKLKFTLKTIYVNR